MLLRNSTLEHLVLHRCGVKDAGGAAICNALRQSTSAQLQTLDLSNNPLGPKTAALIATLLVGGVVFSLLFLTTASYALMFAAAVSSPCSKPRRASCLALVWMRAASPQAVGCRSPMPSHTIAACACVAAPRPAAPIAPAPTHRWCICIDAGAVHAALRAAA